MAAEPVDDADIRIVLTIGRAGPRFEVLTRTEPFQIAPSALQAELEDGGRLGVWIFAFRQADLAARFPGLATLSALDIAIALEPSLEPPGPGRYEPPPPVRVLQTELTDDSDREVTYTDVDWAATRANPATAFTVALAGALACPPLDRPFRVFVRDAPEQVCVYTKDDACRWVSDGCPNASALGISEAGTIRETPASGLIVDGRLCRPTAALTDRRGETDAWQCDDRVLAAQRQVDRQAGIPWRLDGATSITNLELARDGRFALGAAGAWYGVERQERDIRIRRVLIDDTSPSYQPSLIPLPDDGDGRRIRSEDGRQVTLENGTFKFSVGRGPQCLRRPAAVGGDSFFAIQQSQATSIELSPPGLGTALDSTFVWSVAGEPGQIDTADPPGQANLRLPGDMGPISSLTITNELTAVLLHGRNRSFRIPRIPEVFLARNLFGCPAEIPHPPDLVGDIVIAGREHFALLRSGVARLDEDGVVVATSSRADANFDDRYRIERRAGPDGRDRAVVFRPEATVAWVFDPAQQTAIRVDLEGPILGTTDGPQGVLRTGANTLTVRSLTPDAPAGTIYHVPAFSPDAAGELRVEAGAVVAAGGRTLVGLSQGADVGVLDLTTGLSQGRRVEPDVRVETIITDEGGQARWLAARARRDDPTFQLIRVPPSPGQ